MTIMQVPQFIPEEVLKKKWLNSFYFIFKVDSITSTSGGCQPINVNVNVNAPQKKFACKE